MKTTLSYTLLIVSWLVVYALGLEAFRSIRTEPCDCTEPKPSIQEPINPLEPSVENSVGSVEKSGIKRQCYYGIDLNKQIRTNV